MADGENPNHGDRAEEDRWQDALDGPPPPLPKLVNVTTGEEEEVLFKHRAKVYRYDTETKQWKERGVGDMKILKHPARNTFRLLLRRELIHKIACNHPVARDIKLVPMYNSETAVTWFAMDHAEDEPRMERLAVRFRHGETRDQFRKVFEECQAKIGSSAPASADDGNDDASTTTEEPTTAEEGSCSSDDSAVLGDAVRDLDRRATENERPADELGATCDAPREFPETSPDNSADVSCVAGATSAGEEEAE